MSLSLRDSGMPSPQDHKPSSLSTLFAAQWRLGGVALEVLAMNVHNQAVRPAFLHMRLGDSLANPPGATHDCRFHT